MAVFKYFMKEDYARSFIDHGVMVLRPLSYFRSYEDGEVRGDPRDGLMTQAPRAGLKIIKQDGAILSMEGWRFTSSAKAENIFVYCASNQLSPTLADRFASPLLSQRPQTIKIS